MGANNDLFQRSIAALASGDLERAKKLLLQILEKDKNNLDLLNFLTSMYQEFSRPQSALRMAKRTTELDPNVPQHWNNLGYLNIILGRWKEAEQCYAKAATMNNATAMIFLNHARVLIELGQTKAATQELQRALKKALTDELVNTIRTDPQFSKLRPLLEKPQ